MTKPGDILIWDINFFFKFDLKKNSEKFGFGLICIVIISL